MKKAKEKTTLFRDLDTVDNVIKLYQSMKMNFCVKNSSYSTVIETDNAQIRFVTQTYSNAVFMAAQKIKSRRKPQRSGQSNHGRQLFDGKL